MIRRVLAPNPGHMTGTGTNTYLLEGGDGRVAVVDPGPDDDGHVRAILDAVGPSGRVEAILVTHGHSDHLPGARPLKRAAGAPVLGHARLPGVDRPLADGETWTLGSLSLVALDTPGHTDDSLCYWLPAERALFTGDVIAGSGTVIVDDAPGGLSKYVGSLRRLLDLGDSHIYPGHGPDVSEGRAKVQEYLDHRGERERQVLEALRGGSRTVQDLVDEIYFDVPSALVPMAARNVRAHLGKLAVEGRAREERGAWSLTSG